MTSILNPPEIVQKWQASYYSEEKKTWLPGFLCVTPVAVIFSTLQAGHEHLVEEDFSKVLSIKKALSSFLFGAIVFNVQDRKSHWFSSFENRNETFLILQHFYQGYLFSSQTNEQKCDRGGLIKSQHSTELGKNILKSVHDSLNTLGKAGTDLQRQGEQLCEAGSTVQDIHEDLSVAERVVGGLSSWFIRWRLPKV